MKQTNIYIDNNASTPMDERVLQAMMPYFTNEFGNAFSTTHRYGWTAKDAVETARNEVAKSVGAEASEITFTSGATDAINQAIIGIFQLFKGHKNHFVVAATEHKAVLSAHHFIEREGAKVTYLGVDRNGWVDLQELENSINEQTAMVSVMLANNETGVIQDAKAIADMVHRKNSIFFCDAVQAFGKIPINVNELGIDIMPLSAHKIYGPKGIGALYTRRKSPRIKLPQLLHQGTPNVPSIVGFGKACSILDIKQIQLLKNEVLSGLQKLGFSLNIAHAKVLPNTLSLRLEGKKASELLTKTSDLSYSLGSACNSNDTTPSHVLSAMGLSEKEIRETIRLSFGRFNSIEEGNIIISKFIEAI
jgi:cysteine desulfurase